MRRNNSSPESKSVNFENEIHGNYKKVGTLIQKQKTQRGRESRVKREKSKGKKKRKFLKGKKWEEEREN